MPFYAVRRGRQPGVFESWPDCEKQVKGYNNPKFKKFATHQEALSFVKGEDGNNTSFTESPQKPAKAPSKEFMPLSSPSGATYNAKKRLLQDNSKDFTYHSTSSSASSGTASFSSTSSSSTSCGQSTTLLSLKHCVKNMRKTSDQLQTYVAQAEDFIAELQGKRAASTESRKNAKKVKTESDFPQSFDNTDKWDTDKQDGPSPAETGVIVYTDGACSDNGKLQAAAGIGVYWGPNNPMNLSERLGGRQTNNRAEIHAAIRAIQQAKQMGIDELTVKTDSNFMIQSITKWINGWKRNGWKLSTGKPVINREDFEELDQVMNGIKINWVHVRGHCGEEGNEAADGLAVAGAHMPPLP